MDIALSCFKGNGNGIAALVQCIIPIPLLPEAEDFAWLSRLEAVIMDSEWLDSARMVKNIPGP